MTEVYLTDADRAVFRRLKSSGHISHDLRHVMTQGYNRCGSCNKSVNGGRPIFAGYNCAGKPLLRCAECSDDLAALATPVYPSGALDLSVGEDQALWRYMDFSKFVATLQQGGLYFTRAAQFTDPFEAAAGLASRQTTYDQHYLKFFKSAVVTPPPGYPVVEKTNNEIEKEANRLLAQLKFAYSKARDLLVSCWHMNDVESEALWQIYCSPGAPGIAIRSSIDRLWRATESENDAIVGKVHYMDFRSQFASGDQRIFCKRSSLAHEREVRAVLSNDAKAPVNGRIITCDLNDLIDDVIISPYAPSWFPAVVQETIEKFGFHLNRRTSEIIERPFY